MNCYEVNFISGPSVVVQDILYLDTYLCVPRSSYNVPWHAAVPRRWVQEGSVMDLMWVCGGSERGLT